MYLAGTTRTRTKDCNFSAFNVISPYRESSYLFLQSIPRYAFLFNLTEAAQQMYPTYSIQKRGRPLELHHLSDCMLYCLTYDVHFPSGFASFYIYIVSSDSPLF